MQWVGVHAVLKGLHLLNNFLQCRVFDAHVIYRVEQRNAIWETLLHLLRHDKTVEGKEKKLKLYTGGFDSDCLSALGSTFPISRWLSFVPVWT